MLTFSRLNENDLELVLEWRTSSHVTKYMYTDIEKNLENQFRWFNKIKDDKTQEHWIIEYKDKKIGLISLSQIDEINKSATSGFYIGDLNFAMIASRIHPYFINYIFFEKKLNKIYIEVMSGNENIVKMDLHYGFRHVGTMKQHIYKNNQFHDIEILELLQSTWVNDYKKYHGLKGLFK